MLFNGHNANNRGQLEAVRANETLARSYCVAPGDRALCMVGGKRRGARQCWLVNVSEPGADRVEPVCPHFGFCGGCTYQHLDYAAQLKLKAAPVEKMLRNAEPGINILPAVPAPTPWHYRSKIEMSFVGDSLGFNIRGLFQRITNVEECFIGPPCCREVISTVRGWQKEYGFPGWEPIAASGFLRYMVIRYSFAAKRFLTALITANPPGFTPDEPGNPLQVLADRLMQIPGSAGVIHILHNGISPAVRVEEERLLAGVPEIYERVNDLEFSLGWCSFFQSNPPAYANMLRTVREWCGRQEKILDLYCGVGSIGLSLDGPLTGVEMVEQAISNAKRNAERLGRTDADFHCANSEDWPSLDCSLLILDPPRSGCHPKMIERVVNEGPERLLYISCNYQRLIDEYKVLKSRYKIEKAQLYDFFPHTPHIETVCLMSKI